MLISTHKQPVQSLIDLMQYRKFWRRDHENRCDVVCYHFELPEVCKRIKFVEELSPYLRVQNLETRELVDYLKSEGINAYVHYGPTGVIFVAVDVKDKDKLQGLLNA